MLKIFLVDHHILFREGLVSLLQREEDLRIVGEAGSIAQAIALLRNCDPDVLLVDAELPDLGESCRGIRQLLAVYPLMQVILLNQDESRDRFLQALQNGARGYLTKNYSLSGLVQSVRAIQRGEAVIPRAMVGHLLDELTRLAPVLDHEEISLLTPREMEVLRELGRGGSNQQIAEYLEIAENTVKVHVHNILDKLNLPNRRQAARFARTKGISKIDTSYRMMAFG